MDIKNKNCYRQQQDIWGFATLMGLSVIEQGDVMGWITIPAHGLDYQVCPKQNGAVITRKNEVQKDVLNAFFETIKQAIKDFQRKT